MKHSTRLVIFAALLSLIAAGVVGWYRYHSLTGEIAGEVHMAEPEVRMAEPMVDSGSPRMLDAGFDAADIFDARAPDIGSSLPARLARGGLQCAAAATFRLVPTTSPKIAYARIFWSEADPDADEDHRVIFNVLANTRNRSCNLERYSKISQCSHGGETMLSIARRTASRSTGGRVLWEPDFDVCRMTHRQRWIATLQDNDDPPSAWVECRPGQRAGRRHNYCSGRWSQYVNDWRRLRRKSARWLRQGRVPHSCRASTRIVAWGGVMDNHIAYRRGLVLVECAAVILNRVWRFPSAEEKDLLRSGVLTYSRGVLTRVGSGDAGVTSAEDASAPE